MKCEAVKEIDGLRMDLAPLGEAPSTLQDLSHLLIDWVLPWAISYPLVQRAESVILERNYPFSTIRLPIDTGQ